MVAPLEIVDSTCRNRGDAPTTSLKVPTSNTKGLGPVEGFLRPRDKSKPQTCDPKSEACQMSSDKTETN